MSIRYSRRVWDDVPLEGTNLLLLLAIADHANDEGICWPSIDRLAGLVRRSVRQTRRLLRLLESGGYISTTTGCGRGHATVIRVNPLPFPVIVEDGISTVHGKAVTDDRFSARMEDMSVPFSETKVDMDDYLSDAKAVMDVVVSEAKADTGDHLSIAKADIDVPLSSNERRTSSAQTQSPVTQKRTPSARKADIAPHACVEPLKNHQLNHQETSASFLAPQLIAENDERAEKGSPSLKGSTAKRARPSIAEAVGKVVGEVAEARNQQHAEERAEERVETEQQRFFRVVAWVLGWEVKALSKEQRGTVAQTIGYLTKSGYTENDVRRFWSEIWLNDWRWKRNREHPRPLQLRSEIFRLRAATTLAQEAAPQSSHHDLTPEELELREKVREARIHGRYSPTSTLRERLRLPDLQGHEVGLSNRRSEESSLREGVQVPMSGRD